MKANESLRLSLRFNEMLKSDLSHAFSECLPAGMIEEKAKPLNLKGRNCVFTPVNVILSMLLTAIQEDKSFRSGLNLFKTVFESNGQLILKEEAEQLAAEKINAGQLPAKAGRPGSYKSRLPKSCRNTLSDNTSGYSNARKNPDISIFKDVFTCSADFGDLDTERRHGMKTYMTDGTYLQLQDHGGYKKPVCRKRSGRFISTGFTSSFDQAGYGTGKPVCTGFPQCVRIAISDSHDTKPGRKQFAACR
jgi:hypothetical protein